METNAGLGLYALCMKSSMLGYRETIAILHAGLVGADEKSPNNPNETITLNEVGALVLEHGFAEVNKVVVKFLLIIMKGPNGQEQKKNDSPKKKRLK
jgi:hypothetical protein